VRNHFRVAWLAVAVLIVVNGRNARGLRAQSQTAGSPAFEVASVKPNKSGDGFTTLRFAAGGRITVTNISLRELLKLAYDIKDFQLAGGPSWITSDRFDVEAKAESEAPPQQLWPMVRTLAADRFKLVVHTETRELPIYALIMARKDGRLGPQLRQSEVDCAALRAARDRASAAPPGLPPPLQQGMRPVCGSNGSPGRRAGGAVTMEELASNLSSGANRVVVDQTGLTGRFDYQLEWTPDQLPPPLPPSARPDAPPPPPPSPADGPSIFTAVQEQLGLKLESQKGPVDVLVIDSVEKPSPD
jgi:uncharacterized protein (TIGR03435 family)